MNGIAIVMAGRSHSVACPRRKQARAALKLKAQSVFEQAFELQERLTQQHEEKTKQRALCEQLANQVLSC